MTETEEFILKHREEDVNKLALTKAGSDGVDMPFALQQIEGWQKAKQKLPSYASIDGILYPPRLSMEQCSSEKTAKYKAQLIKNLGFNGKTNTNGSSDYNDISDANDSSDSNSSSDSNGEKKFEGCVSSSDNNTPDANSSFIDITGGFGVDFSFIAKAFDNQTIVEQQPVLCDALRHNLPLLGLAKAEVICGDGIEYLQSQNSHFTVIYLDPARRDAHGKKMVSLSDCHPDAALHLPLLLEKADTIIIKLSPMLDITKALEEMRGHVAEVHIVAVKNECKELLLVIKLEISEKVKVVCVNDDEIFTFHRSDGGNIFTNPISTEPQQLSLQEAQWLYEPNASVMKAGCFDILPAATGTVEIARNSHLFISKEPAASFPGRAFRISTVSSLNNKELRTALSGITHANVAVRNFPMKAEELAKKLHLKDGGTAFIFATTDAANKKWLILCHR